MPLDYQTPDPHDPKRIWRDIGRVLLIIAGIVFLLVLILFGTCALLMMKR
jgi:hypothetical protein